MVISGGDGRAWALAGQNKIRIDSHQPSLNQKLAKQIVFAAKAFKKDVHFSRNVWHDGGEMNLEVDTRQVTAVEIEVQKAYRAVFPRGDKTFVSQVFQWARECFEGNYKDYQAIDARYHDFEHTLQGTLCMARLMQGRHASKVAPPLTQRIFELGILAILLHDTGYLKKKDDVEGTGAKYTLTHVNRSVDFADELLKEKGYLEKDIKAVQNMIRCTGVNVDLTGIPFQDDMERIVGFGLGTADLLGQMAAKDYVDKLPVLYSEFAESNRYNVGKGTATGMFMSAHDLMQKTPVFWEKYVQPKLDRDFQGVYRYLNFAFPNGENFYLQRIENNLALLRDRVPVSA